MNKEFRMLNDNISVNSDSRSVEGYALLFNVLSNKMIDKNGKEFYEIIDSNALDGVLENSNVIALINHNSDRGILAKYKKGEGSLKLEVDEKGLKYSFEAPQTSLGDELIEMLKRGDITSSSFAFTIGKSTLKKEDGKLIRYINKIDGLYDVSPVYFPAYENTEVFLRTIEIDENLIENEIENNENSKSEVRNNEDKIEENEIKIDNIDDKTKNEIYENNIENNIEIDEKIEEKRNEDFDQKNNTYSINNNIDLSENKKIIKRKKTMENFKLIDLINKIVEKRELSEMEQNILDFGKNEFRKSGISATGSIQLPVNYRADITATGSGAGVENVSEEKMQIVTPLYANMALVKAGAQVLTGLVGDVSIPSYAGTSVAWKGENVSAVDGGGAFSEVILKPKRLTAYVNVSKQFLLQDTNDANTMLVNDIYAQISGKIESTVLSNLAGSTTQPTGLFYAVSGSTVSPSYTGITALEYAIENKNVNNYKFICSPSAKAALKATKINEGRMVFENGAIDGVEAIVTSNVYSKGVIGADFSNLAIGIWGIDITVDPYSLAGDGKVKLIVNAYVDAAFRRDAYSAIVLA